jgi:hypothetical protein
MEGRKALLQQRHKTFDKGLNYLKHLDKMSWSIARPTSRRHPLHQQNALA